MPHSVNVFAPQQGSVVNQFVKIGDLVQKNSFTARVNAADEARDQPIRGFSKIVKGMLHHFNPAVAQAAYNIDLINEKFSKITRLSDEKQTAAEESYITALKAAAADLTTLGLTDWLTAVGTSRTDGTVSLDFKIRRRF